MVSTRRRFLVSALLLALGVAAVYAQTGWHEFVHYDDNAYILDNPAVIGGLTVPGVRWAFGFHAANWHPLTWLSHMLDCQLFGLWAGGHHLTSAGIHAGNAVLLLAVLATMTGSFARSAAVAALFALHPLRVESVAWAAERKDVLAGLLFLLTMLAYVHHARRPGTARFLATLGLFALGLTAKPTLVTLPFVLLLLDWWPLGRALPIPRANDGPRATRRAWPALVLEKAPFFALSLVSSLVTLRASQSGSLPMVNPDYATTYGNAVLSCVRYLGSFAWPLRLAPLYPYPVAGIPREAAAAATAALLLATAAAFFRSRRRPYLPVGWLWFLGMLVPVSGIVQTGSLARADRYTYLSMIGVAIAVVWLAGDLAPRRARARAALAGVFAAVLAALAAASFAYVRIWRDDLSLFGYAARVTRDNGVMLNNYAGALGSAGRDEEAIRVLEEAVRIDPHYCNPHLNLGRTLAGLGRYQEALEPLNRALLCFELRGRKAAEVAATHAALGNCFLLLGRFADAEWHFLALLEIYPDSPEGRAGLLAAGAERSP